MSHTSPSCDGRDRKSWRPLSAVPRPGQSVWGLGRGRVCLPTNLGTGEPWKVARSLRSDSGGKGGSCSPDPGRDSYSRPCWGEVGGGAGHQLGPWGGGAGLVTGAQTCATPFCVGAGIPAPERWAASLPRRPPPPAGVSGWALGPQGPWWAPRPLCLVGCSEARTHMARASRPEPSAGGAGRGLA